MMKEINLFEELNNIFKMEVKTSFKTDILETQEGYELYANLPGLEKSDLLIEFSKGNLVIKSQKKEDDKNGKYILKERTHNNLERTFYFGEDVDRESIKAKMSDGVLCVSINFLKKEETKKSIIIE